MAIDLSQPRQSGVRAKKLIPLIALVCAGAASSFVPALGAESEERTIPVVEVKESTLLPEVAPHVFGRHQEFSFEKGASDGKEWWYLVRLRLRLVYAGNRPRKLTEVSASVNHLAANSIQVRSSYSARCKGMEVTATSLDLIQGYVKRQRCGHSITLTSLNFTQLHAIRPGEATFDVGVSGDLHSPDSVTLLSGSGVVKSHNGPAKLEFAALAPIHSAPIGEWTKVPFELVNRGERPVRHILVGVAAEAGVRTKPKGVHIRKTIPPHGEARGEFSIFPKREGNFRLWLSATSTANSPGAEISFHASTDSHR